MSRKDFFRSSLKYFFDTVNEFSMASKVPEARDISTSPILFRPPGAIEEEDFLKKCTRCDRCIDACPKQAIVKFTRPDNVSYMTPTLFFKKSACVLCDTFPCITACNEGALIMPESKSEVRMGRAFIVEEFCRAWQGGACMECYNICPLKDDAIFMDEEGRPVISIYHCVGCGLCVQTCPTPRPGIIVKKC